MPIVGGVYVADVLPSERSDSSAEPLLLIHGAGGSHLDWPPGVRRRSDRRVLALDLPGHGKSAGTARTSISDYARDVIAFLDRLNTPRVVAMGHSMGGAIALTLALDHADRVSGLILVSTGAKLCVGAPIMNGLLSDPTLAARQIAEACWPTGAELARDAMADRLQKVSPETLYGDFVACNGFDVMRRLSDIHTPTLMLVGAEDRMTPARYSEYLAGGIADAQLVMLAGEHMVMLEQPIGFTAQVTGWLERHAAPGR